MEYPGSIINYHLFEIREMEHFSERTFNVCLEESLDSLFKIIAFYYKHGFLIGNNPVIFWAVGLIAHMHVHTSVADRQGIGSHHAASTSMVGMNW